MLLTLSINIPVIVPVSPISERQPRVFCLHRLRVLTFFFAKMRQIRLRQLRMLGFQMNILLIIVWLSVNSNSPCSEASIMRAALCQPPSVHCRVWSNVGRKENVAKSLEWTETWDQASIGRNGSSLTALM